MVDPDSARAASPTLPRHPNHTSKDQYSHRTVAQILDAQQQAAVQRRLVRAKGQARARRAACGAVATITFGIVPLAVISFAALLSMFLWAVECHKDNNRCDWYQWFLYVMGNLIGLANPLTNISPSNGGLSQIIDLLVSVWALSVAGTAIGIVSALVAVTTTASSIEKTLNSAFKCDRNALTLKAQMLDFEGFVHGMRDPTSDAAVFEDELTEDQMRMLFKRHAREHMPFTSPKHNPLASPCARLRSAARRGC
jgi:hypothetical protein